MLHIMHIMLIMQLILILIPVPGSGHIVHILHILIVDQPQPGWISVNLQSSMSAVCDSSVLHIGTPSSGSSRRDRNNMQ